MTETWDEGIPRSLLTLTLGVTAAMVLLISIQATTAQRVLIIGGADHSGSAVARMLIERGDHVTPYVRSITHHPKRNDWI